MKKLSLEAFPFQKAEVLTRSQLKKVMGGMGSDELGSGDENECPDECQTSADCGYKRICGTTSCIKRDHTQVSVKFCMADPKP